MPCSGITQFHRMLPLIMVALLALGCQSGGLVCGKSAQFGIRAMLQCNEVTQLPVCCTLISLLCYVGHPVSQKKKKKSIKKVKYFVDKNSNPMNEGYFDICVMPIATSNTHCLIFVVV